MIPEIGRLSPCSRELKHSRVKVAFILFRESEYGLASGCKTRISYGRRSAVSDNAEIGYNAPCGALVHYLDGTGDDRYIPGCFLAVDRAFRWTARATFPPCRSARNRILRMASHVLGPGQTYCNPPRNASPASRPRLSFHPGVDDPLGLYNYHRDGATRLRSQRRS